MKPKEKGPKSFKDHKCTDLLCCVIFIVFVGIIGGILGLAISTGDYAQLFYEQDYLGNRCGTGDYADKPKAFYPRIPRDMFEQQDVVSSGSFSKLRLYALCVKKCPDAFDPYDLDGSYIKDYGYDPESATTQALGSGTQEEWLSLTPTLDIVNRCIPKADSTTGETEMCAFPNCTSAEATAVGAVCADTEPFTRGEWSMCVESGSGAVSSGTCSKQKEVCKVRARETTTLTFELATENEAEAAMLQEVAEVTGGVYEIMTSIYNSILIIVVGGVGLPIALAFGYMMLLFMFAKIIIYTLLFMMIFAQLLATFVCFSRSGIEFQGVSGADMVDTASSKGNVSVPDAAAALLGEVEEDSKWLYSVGFVLLGLMTVISLITVILARKKIAIATAIITEATTVFATMPLLMFFPTCGTIAQVVVCFWFVASITLVQTTKPESLDSALDLAINETAIEMAGFSVADVNVDPIDGLRDLVEADYYTNLASLVILYGFYVLVQFVQGISWTTMSGATYWWYYYRTETDPEKTTKWPIVTSLKIMCTYHAGSVAFAAFVIALCDLLRAIASYVEQQMGPAKNKLMEIAFKVIHCCLWCLKKTVKFVSYYGLVFVAAQGYSFCMGCYKTFFFFLQHPGQVAINATVVSLLRLIAILSMPLMSAVLFYYVLDSTLDEQYNAIYPALCIFMLAVTMTTACMSVFECVITTIFVAAFQDKAEFEGKYMSDRLAKAFGIPKGKTEDATPAADAAEETQKL